MKLKFPVRELYKNLMYTTNNEIWAYYRIKGRALAITDDKGKGELKRKFSNTLRDLKEYGDLDIWMLPRDMTLEERFHAMKGDFAEDCYEVACHYAKETVSRLEKEMGMISTYDWIIGVPIQSQYVSDSLLEGAKLGYEQVEAWVMNTLNFEKEMTQEQLESYLPVAYEVGRRLSGLHATALTVEEMVYLNRVNFIRNMPHTMEEEQINDSIENMTDGIQDPCKRIGTLQLESIEGRSSIAFLPVSDTDNVINHLDIAEVVQTLPFPLELRYKVKFERLKGATGVEGKAKRSGLRLKNIVKESRAVGNREHKEINESRIIAEDAKDKILAETPFLLWQGFICIYAQNEKQLRNRVSTTIRMFRARKIKIARAQADQMALFYKNMMGVPLASREKNWIQETTCEGFAENLIGLTQTIGNSTGWYIGRVDPHVSEARDLKTAIRSSRNIVLLNPFSANKVFEKNRSASVHIAITGETGQGKTYLSSLLSTYLSFMRVKQLFIDPKSLKGKRYEAFVQNEDNRKNYPLYVEHIEKNFTFLTLDSDNKHMHGVLDPITFLQGVDAKDTAEAILLQVFPNLSSYVKGHTEVLRAIKEVVKRRELGEIVGMTTVLEMLSRSEIAEVKEIADLLKEKIEGSILQLAFSNGQTQGISFEKRITYLGVKGMELPEERTDPKYYSDSERKCLALMMCLGKFCAVFGSQNPNEETVEIIEEAWVFQVSAIGKKILNSCKRVGREQNNMLIYSTQSVNDVNSEESHGNFGTLFAFNEPTEQEKILKHVRIADHEKNREWVDNMRKGQCLMNDVNRRVGRISIDALFPEFDLTFRTVATTESSRAEEHYAL